MNKNKNSLEEHRDSLAIEEQLQALNNLSENEIDYSDIPEIDFSNAERGRFYRPVKQAVTLRLDADVVEWFKRHYPKYQTAINKALRDHVITQS